MNKKPTAFKADTKGFLVWDEAETGWLIIIARSPSHARTLYCRETNQIPPWRFGEVPNKLYCRRAPAYDGLQRYGSVVGKDMIPAHYMAAMNDNFPDPKAMPRKRL